MLSFILDMWSTGTVKFISWHVRFFMLITTKSVFRSGLNNLFASQNPRKFCVYRSWGHIQVCTNGIFQFSQIFVAWTLFIRSITLQIQSHRVLFFSVLQSLIIWFIVSPLCLSSNVLHLYIYSMSHHVLCFWFIFESIHVAVFLPITSLPSRLGAVEYTDCFSAER